MLYVFDCDGVLIDSEIIAAEVDAELLAEAGYEITAEEMTHRFAGATIRMIVDRIREEAGLVLPEDFIDRQREETDRRLGEEVDPVAGVEAMLDNLDGPRCVCSNSSNKRLQITLERTQLYSRFAPHIFSAVEVGTREPKPAPNVYLHAASTMGFDPSEAVVLEDSVYGIAAARAAGMRAIGFTGGAHTYPGHADQLTDAGAETVINRHADYRETAKALVSWRAEAV